MVKIDKIETHPPVTCTGDRNLAATDPQATQRRLEHRSTDRIQNGINTFAVSQFKSAFGQILGSGVNDGNSPRNRIRAASRAEHARFSPVCNLRRRLADGAASADNQNRFSSLKLRGTHQGKPGSDKRNTDSGRLLQAKRPW